MAGHAFPSAAEPAIFSTAAERKLFPLFPPAVIGPHSVNAHKRRQDKSKAEAISEAFPARRIVRFNDTDEVAAAWEKSEDSEAAAVPHHGQWPSWDDVSLQGSMVTF